MPWQVLSVLPNLDLHVAIEARQTAFVPPSDERVVALRAHRPNFDLFLGQFRSAHGNNVDPAVMLLHAEAPDTRRTEEAMVGLRNCLAIATVTHQTAIEMLHPHGHRILFSDPFDFYPWSLDRDYERMISITPAIMALHRVRDFAGQPAPGTPVHRLHTTDIDRELFSELAAHWDEAYGRRRMSLIDRTLFRSLNMANAAMAMPATKGATFLDYGRQCALWISAFEILAYFHAGRDRADLPAVLALLGEKPFLTRALNARRFSIRYRGREARYGLPMKLYEQLYQVRNAFLHGNPVTVRSLQLPGGRFIGRFAPLLYRCALRTFLAMRFVPAAAPRDERERIAARFAESRYERAQYDVEEALQLARRPLDTDED